MRLRTSAIVMCLLIAIPAAAASRRDHANCNGDDVNRRIYGCTRIIDDTSEDPKVRSIAHVSRALAWQSRSDREKALIDYAEAIRLNPDDALAYSNRGVLWRELNEIDRAIADFDAAIRRNPRPRSDEAGPGFVNVHTNRGLAWHAKGDGERALADFDKATGIDPNDRTAHYYRGRLHFEKGDYVKAIADFDALIRLEPLPQAYHMRGLSHYHQYMSGSAWIRQEDIDQAIADFTRALERNPGDTDTLYMRARARAVSGDRGGAIADLTEAYRLDPLHVEVRLALKELQPDYEEPKESVLNLLKREEKEKR